MICGKTEKLLLGQCKSYIDISSCTGAFSPSIGKQSGGVMATYWWVYLFHMPAFVFVSGVFSKSYVEKMGKEFRLTGFLVIYVVFTVLLWIIQLFFRHSINITNLLSTSGAPWYMLAMFSWYLILPYTARIKPVILVTISMAVALLSGIYSDCGDFLALSRTIVFYPFFMFGYYFSITAINRIKPWMRICGGIILSIIFIALLVKGQELVSYLGIAYGYEAYSSLGMPPVTGMFVRFIWYTVAILMTLSFLMIVPNRSFKWTRIGERTLGIYVVHRLIREIFSGFGLYKILSGAGVITLIILLTLSALVVVIASAGVINKVVNRAFHATIFIK